MTTRDDGAPLPPDGILDGEVVERDGYKLLAQGDGTRVQRSYAVLAANGIGLGAFADLAQAEQVGTEYATTNQLTDDLRRLVDEEIALREDARRDAEPDDA